MKIQFLSTLLLFFLIGSCSKPSPIEKVINDTFIPNKGTEPVKEKILKKTFSGVIISNSLSCEIYKSNHHKVIIEAPADILDNIEAKLIDGKMVLGVSKSFGNISTERVKVKIYTPDFISLEANTSAMVKIKDTFIQDKLFVNVSTSASVEGTLEANFLKIVVSSSADFSGKVWADQGELNVSSSGNITTSGKIQHANLLASTSGSLDAKNTEIGKAKMNANTSGNISASVYGDSSATATTSGSIQLKKKGNLKISVTENTSGNVDVM